MNISKTPITFNDFVPKGLTEDYLAGKCREIEIKCQGNSQYADKAILMYSSKMGSNNENLFLCFKFDFSKKVFFSDF